MGSSVAMVTYGLLLTLCFITMALPVRGATFKVDCGNEIANNEPLGILDRLWETLQHYATVVPELVETAVETFQTSRHVIDLSPNVLNAIKEQRDSNNEVLNNMVRPSLDKLNIAIDKSSSVTDRMGNVIDKLSVVIDVFIVLMFLLLGALSSILQKYSSRFVKPVLWLIEIVSYITAALLVMAGIGRATGHKLPYDYLVYVATFMLLASVLNVLYTERDSLWLMYCWLLQKLFSLGLSKPVLLLIVKFSMVVITIVLRIFSGHQPSPFHMDNIFTGSCIIVIVNEMYTKRESLWLMFDRFRYFVGTCLHRAHAYKAPP